MPGAASDRCVDAGDGAGRGRWPTPRCAGHTANEWHIGTDTGSVVDLGISDADHVAIAHGLERLLADSYTLHLKAQNLNWNVTGATLSTLHGMFEGQSRSSDRKSVV
jgi:hypothetical protein